MGRLFVPSLVLVNLAFAVVANVAFKYSAHSHLRGFLAWQLVGNLAGLGTVLTLTALLRFLPLNYAWALTGGLGFMAVEVFGAHYLLGEPVSQTQWLGVLLISGGITLVVLGR